MEKLFLGFFLLCWACSQGQSNGVTPEIPETPESDVILTFSGIPDSILVESSSEFIFKIEQKGFNKIFELTIDTIIPEYTSQNWIDWSRVAEGQDQIPEDAIIKIHRRGIDLMVNDNPLQKGMPIQAGRLNRLKFYNPLVVGEYKLIFNIKGKNDKMTEKELKLKVYSPEIRIHVFDIDPWLDLKIWDKDFYKILNENYTFSPLSSVFVGRETDTLFSYETPKPGYQGQWTFPGIGTTIYFEQDNGKTFSYFADESNLSNAFFTRWDNDVQHPASTLPQQAGFHCLEFTSWEFAKSGKYDVVISLTDYWGKTSRKKITVNAEAGH